MIKSSCCSCLGTFSFLGAIFYGILAVMTLRRNIVFLEHKVGMDQFTWTDETIDQKFWQIATAAIVRLLPLNSVSGHGGLDGPVLRRRVFPESPREQNGGGRAVRAHHLGSDCVHDPGSGDDSARRRGNQLRGRYGRNNC